MHASSKRLNNFLVQASAVAVILLCLMTGGLQRTAWAQNPAVSPDSREFLGKMSQSLSEIVGVARPSVVNISTTTVSMRQSPFGDFFNDPMFRRFFGERHPRKFKQPALGSGVIVSKDGYILTSNHVVKNADEIKVILYDKREFKGKVAL